MARRDPVPALTANGLPVGGRAGSLAGLQLVPAAAFESYCTPGTSASGCAATLAGAGIPSASSSSGFVLSAANVEGAKDGLFFFGTNGRQASPWGSGTVQAQLWYRDPFNTSNQTTSLSNAIEFTVAP